MRAISADQSSSLHRISTGVEGLDRLINGGFRPHTVNVVLGDTGTGKSSFAWHFIGEDSVPVVYMSLEEDLDQIREEALSLGLQNIESKLSKRELYFVAAFENIDRETTAGQVAKSFFDIELPKRIDEFRQISGKGPGIKFIIDPLTPLLFEIMELRHQRETINRIFRTLRSIGTTLVTVERGFGNHDIKVPLFLADSVIELDFLGLGSHYNRTLTVRKFRGSSHSERPVPFIFKAKKGLTVLE